ncbi:hypothetical protein LOCC1_G007601 [Lachnellula occidentalis]|uniref:Uncharacterized protein n=1 Tax=Lachnellula occidentalis TaxID=215460 RepID=A0A8H8U983_9HELO|nr:hypothetical protein LOCC1_G007601 [Lachnellula occidentalis]
MSLTAAGTTPALTTTFIPTATTCTENRLTMLANKAFQIWMNEPVPVPGTTLTDCYPSQFANSYLLSAGGVTRPAFNPLICPENYATMGPFTSNYIACCPSGYSLAQASVTPFSDRPAFGATCYTPLTSGVAVPVTAYGTSGVTATTTFKATVSDAQAYAYPLEGYAFGVAAVASILPTTTSTASASTNTAASATGAQNSTSTSAATDHTSPAVSHKTSPGIIAMGVVVGVVGFALMVLGFILFRRWKQKAQAKQATEHMDTTSTEVMNQQEGGVYAGRDWKQLGDENYPPREHELHGASSPVELAALESSRLSRPYGSEEAKSNFI